MAETLLRALFLAVAIVVTTAGPASAQPLGPPPRVETRAALLPGGGAARLTVTLAGRDEDCSGQLAIPGSEPFTVYRGLVAGTLVAGHGGVLVALAVQDPREPFRVGLIRREGEGAGWGLGAPSAVARPSPRDDIPFAVVATALPEGFAVFFQEVEVRDPTAAHTYLLRMDPQGQPLGPAQEVRVPWALADAVWNGQGYHLALIYSGGAGGMRLSMVSLTPEGEPQQHPDWASRAGIIADVHLSSEGGRVRAFYRGGPGGDRLLERDVTAVGAWGREPPPPRDHGALGRNEVITVAGGAPRRVSLRP